MIDHKLLRKINSGRCFAFIGSGPSCEVGYPSWENLADNIFQVLKGDGYIREDASYIRYLKEMKYPELFRKAEHDLGSREKLVEIVKGLMALTIRRQGYIYDILCKWPFACYLTTNYDDELLLRLRRNGEYFSVLRNRLEDFYGIRDGASNLIIKLHSDLNYPDEVIITSTDYQRLYSESGGQYFREKLQQIFQMFDVFIIGYSLSDPNIEYVLRKARETASPTHPIYMVASDVTKGQETEYLEKYNIILAGYSNFDGQHLQLRRALMAVNSFIVPRGRSFVRVASQMPPIEEVETASALSIFRRLQPARCALDLKPLILMSLSTVSQPGVELPDMLQLSPIRTVSKTGVEMLELVREDTRDLVGGKFVSEKSDKYSITDAGLQRVKEFHSTRNIEREQAFGKFLIDLKTQYENVSTEEEEVCKKTAEKVILSTFAKRGLTIANKVFTGQTADSEELTDIFGYVSQAARTLESNYLRAAFMDAMYLFLVSPNEVQKKYLASISQGYFLFHLLGLDPKCAKLRREIFENTLWLCDSSVILPFVATGCYNHEYAKELFRMLAQSKAVLYTTPNLLREAWEHFYWAVSFVKRNATQSPEFLKAALVKGSYTQNLFLDGYIRLSALGRVGNYEEYIDLVCTSEKDISYLEDKVQQLGIRLLNLPEIEGFNQADWGEVEEVKAKIQEEREEKGTFRSDLQIKSEAEIWVLLDSLRNGKFSIPGNKLRLEKYYFLSLSRILDRVFRSQSITTWTPEDLYRYLSALPDEDTNPELLQQCMLHEYYYAGVSFIDKERYLRFFGPSIDASKASFEQERQKYEAEVENTHIRDSGETFDNTPDLEKPFFITQLSWRLAESARHAEEIAVQRASDAEAKVKQLEAERERAWKRREKTIKEQEAAHERNVKDLKHSRRRLRQAKKRKKK